jgi:hypothetical protein
MLGVRAQDVKQMHATASPCFCSRSRCHRFLGHYLCAFVQTGEGPSRFSPIDPVRRVEEGDGYLWFDEEGPHTAWRVHLPTEGKPRTTGIFVERFDGREYIRVICRGCRRNEPKLAEDIAPEIANAEDVASAIADAGGDVPPEIANAAGGVVYYV